MSPPPDKTSLFEAWLEEHRGIIVKVTRSFAPVPTDAADLQQEMLLRLWTSISSFAGQSKPSTWIYRICLNTALTWKRGRSRREQHFEREADLATLPSGAPSPADRASDEEMLAELYTAIRTLPIFDRALILLSLDGLAYREISEITGLTENHVGVWLTRARQRLAAGMKGVTHEIK